MDNPNRSIIDQLANKPNPTLADTQEMARLADQDFWWVMRREHPLPPSPPKPAAIPITGDCGVMD